MSPLNSAQHRLWTLEETAMQERDDFTETFMVKRFLNIFEF